MVLCELIIFRVDFLYFLKQKKAFLKHIIHLPQKTMIFLVTDMESTVILLVILNKNLMYLITMSCE